MEGLSSQSVDNSRDVDLSGSEQSGHLEVGDLLVRLGLQEVDILVIRHLGEDLEVRVALLDGLVDKDRLSIQQLILDLGRRGGGWIVAQNHCLVGFVDLGLPEDL